LADKRHNPRSSGHPAAAETCAAVSLSRNTFPGFGGAGIESTSAQTSSPATDSPGAGAVVFHFGCGVRVLAQRWVTRDSNHRLARWPGTLL